MLGVGAWREGGDAMVGHVMPIVGSKQNLLYAGEVAGCRGSVRPWRFRGCTQKVAMPSLTSVPSGRSDDRAPHRHSGLIGHRFAPLASAPVASSNVNSDGPAGAAGGWGGSGAVCRQLNRLWGGPSAATSVDRAAWRRSMRMIRNLCVHEPGRVGSCSLLQRQRESHAWGMGLVCRPAMV